MGGGGFCGNEKDIFLVASKSVRSLYEACGAEGLLFDKHEYAKTLKCGHAEVPITCYSKKVKGSPSRRFKATVELPNITPKQLVEFISDTAHRKTWDTSLSELEEVVVAEGDELERMIGSDRALSGLVMPSVDPPSTQEWREKYQVKNKCAILRCTTKQFGPVTGRDFVDATILRTLCNGSIISAGGSLSDSQKGKLFPTTSGVVRGHNEFGCGWYFENLEEQAGRDRTRVHYSVHSDLKGWFSPSLTNKLMGGIFCTFFEDLIPALLARGFDIGEAPIFSHPLDVNEIPRCSID